MKILSLRLFLDLKANKSFNIPVLTSLEPLLNNFTKQFLGWDLQSNTVSITTQRWKKLLARSNTRN